MDFSSIHRALESLRRRQPPLPARVIELADQLEQQSSSNDNNEAYLNDLIELLMFEPEVEEGKKERWEPLAVGLFISTEVLKDKNATEPPPNGAAEAAIHGAIDGSAVYMDGPRVPHTVAMTTTETTATAEAPATTNSVPELTVDQITTLCETLHALALQHMEHNEPRVRTLVAKCVGAYSRATLSLEPTTSTTTTTTMRQAIYNRLVDSTHDHLKLGRDSEGHYSKSSTGALDDTTGWRAIETNWLCLAALIHALGPRYWTEFPLSNKSENNTNENQTKAFQLLEDNQHSCIHHPNRHVRAAAMTVLEQWTLAAARSQEPNIRALLLLDETNSNSSPLLRMSVKAVLTTGLADNWSQVRMAASVLCRVFLTNLQALQSPLDDILPVLLPRMCLNRFYLAQGVKLYSHETWKLVVKDQGLPLVAQFLPATIRYYVKMCDADNHAVREAACQAIAELAVRLGENPSKDYRETLQPHVDTLLQALLMCFHDESWPVRDEACLACGTLCKSYPEDCRPELKTLWERWTAQLTDQIWSVREDAAVALGDAVLAYGAPFLDQVREFLKKNLPAARDQPAMSASEYKAHVNDMEAHSNSTLYSCGSLAPKLRKGGAGRIGCTSCGIDRPKAPWEATDGCIYLLRELCIHCASPETAETAAAVGITLTDDELLPILRELADVCRVQHFPQANDLRTTLWKQLPAMAHAIGKQRFKTHYLEIFMDLLFRTLESSSSASSSQSQLCVHAAGQCAEELADFVGRSIFRGRLEDESQQRTFDRVMRERQLLPKGPSGGDPTGAAAMGSFSPFGPPPTTTLFPGAQ